MYIFDVPFDFSALNQKKNIFGNLKISENLSNQKTN